MNQVAVIKGRESNKKVGEKSCRWNKKNAYRRKLRLTYEKLSRLIEEGIIRYGRRREIQLSMSVGFHRCLEIAVFLASNKTPCKLKDLREFAKSSIYFKGIKRTASWNKVLRRILLCLQYIGLVEQKGIFYIAKFELVKSRKKTLKRDDVYLLIIKINKIEKTLSNIEKRVIRTENILLKIINGSLIRPRFETLERSSLS